MRGFKGFVFGPQGFRVEGVLDLFGVSCLGLESLKFRVWGVEGAGLGVSS